MTRAALTHSLAVVAVISGAAATGCKSSPPPPVYTDQLKSQLEALAPTCHPDANAGDPHIKDAFDCTGESAGARVRLTEGRKLWTLTLEFVAKSAATVKPKLRATLPGFVSPKAIETIEAHLEDPARDVTDRGKVTEVDGARVQASKRTLVGYTTYEVHISWPSDD